MKKYSYVSLNTGTFLGAKCEEHRAIIDRYAENGYRYVGYIPTNMDGHGRIVRMDLIFEMDVENNE